MSCITKILELKGDKEVLLPPTKWIAVEGGGEYKGYEYLIVLNTNGHRCGYVAIPPEHPFSKTPEEERCFMSGKKYKHYDYDKLGIDCHGGLTFMAPNHGLKELLNVPCNDMWVGFDCGHYLDASDVEAYKKYYGDANAEERKSFFSAFNDAGATVKSFNYTKKQCEYIIDQLIEKAA